MWWGGPPTPTRWRRLRASYDAIPAGAPVRLAKRTSNLFRARRACRRPGLDVSGPRRRDRGRRRRRGSATADVQGMCTYEDLVDVTLPRGLIPFVVPQLRTHHARRRGHRPRHRVDVVPQRAAARVGARDGRAHRRRARSSPPGPGDDLFDAFPNSYGSLGYATRLRIELEPVPGVRRPAARPLRRPRRRSPRRVDVIVEQRRARRRPGRRRSTAWCSRRGRPT